MEEEEIKWRGFSFKKSTIQINSPFAQQNSSREPAVYEEEDVEVEEEEVELELTPEWKERFTSVYNSLSVKRHRLQELTVEERIHRLEAELEEGFQLARLHLQQM